MRKFIMAAALVSLIFSLHGARCFFEEGAVSLWLPDSWRQVVEPDRIRAESDDARGIFEIYYLDAQTVDEALEEFPLLLGESFQELDVTKGIQERELLGIPAWEIRGSGRRLGETFALRILLAEQEGNVLFLMLACAEPRCPELDSDFTSILESLQIKSEQKTN